MVTQPSPIVAESVLVLPGENIHRKARFLGSENEIDIKGDDA